MFLLSWKGDILDFSLWALLRLIVACQLSFFGCLAIARTLCRLFPVGLDESARVAPFSLEDWKVLCRPYGLLALAMLLAVPFLAIFFLSWVVLGFFVIASALTWYRRAQVGKILETGDFFLYLRRFGAFRDQLVLGELLATVPRGTPVLILAPPSLVA